MALGIVPGVVRVGLTASLSGQFSGQGVQALEGARAWAGDANAAGGIPLGRGGPRLAVQLVSYDDQSKPADARALTERLIVDDGVDLLLGPYSSSLAMAAAEVAEEHRRVLWNHGGASDGIYYRGFQWVVGILTPASRYLLGVVDLVKDLDPHASTMAVLHSSTGSFSAAVASGAEEHAHQRGFRTVFRAQFHSPATDFSDTLEALAREAPDLIIGVGRIEDDLLLARQLVARGQGARAIALVAPGIGQFGESLGPGAYGFMGPSQWEPGVAYTPDYGPSAHELARRHPRFGPGGGDYAMAQAYAAGLVAQRCVEKAASLDNQALRAAAAHLEFTTFYGPFKIDGRTGCQIGRPVVIVQWQGGEKLVVWPRELAQAEPLYPLPQGSSTPQ